MKGSIAPGAAAALGILGTLGALAAPAAAVTGTRAHPPEPPSAELRMTYEHPEISGDHSGVTWHWVLANTGTAGAETVVATHRVSADQKIVGVSPSCVGGAGDAVCRFGWIKPGERRTGWIRTSIVKAGGTLRVSGQVTWRDGTVTRPGIGDLPATDAGAPEAPPASDSWGVADTDAATDVPAQSG